MKIFLYFLIIFLLASCSSINKNKSIKSEKITIASNEEKLLSDSIGLKINYVKNIKIDFEPTSTKPLKGILSIQNLGDKFSQHDYVNVNRYYEHIDPTGKVVRPELVHTLVIGDFNNLDYLTNRKVELRGYMIENYFENPVKGIYTIRDVYNGENHAYDFEIRYFYDPDID